MRTHISDLAYRSFTFDTIEIRIVGVSIAFLDSVVGPSCSLMAIVEQEPTNLSTLAVGSSLSSCVNSRAAVSHRETCYPWKVQNELASAACTASCTSSGRRSVSQKGHIAVSKVDHGVKIR